jgi:hypothetical protein
LQLPLGCPKKPSSYCICQRYLKKGTVVRRRLEIEYGSQIKIDDLTPYQRLQAHAAFAFGIATGADVPQVVL